MTEIAVHIPSGIKTMELAPKKILVDLFVERIELQLVEEADGSKKRQVHIYYRFNPKKWLEWKPRGCTNESLVNNKKRPTDSQKDENGPPAEALA